MATLQSIVAAIREVYPQWERRKKKTTAIFIATHLVKTYIITLYSFLMINFNLERLVTVCTRE